MTMDMKAIITNESPVTRQKLAQELLMQFNDGLITETELENKLLRVGYLLLPEPSYGWVDGWIKVVN